MNTIKSLPFLAVFILFSCKKEDKDTTFKIYHLKPNRVYESTDTVGVYGWFSKRRSDFFVVKNYDINNEQHKIKIDSFIVNYISKDSFLIANKNVNWHLTFFKYGDGIDEHTTNQNDTDYTIHNLFSYKKEIGSVYFDTRTGYSVSNYNVTPEKLNQTKREIISNYFATLNLDLDVREAFTDHLTAVSKNQDTIKVLAKLIKQRGANKVQTSDYLVLKTLQGKVSNDTINVAYYNYKAPEKLEGNTILTLLEFDIVLGVKDHYYFPAYNGTLGSKSIKQKE